MKVLFLSSFILFHCGFIFGNEESSPKSVVFLKKPQNAFGVDKAPFEIGTGMSSLNYNNSGFSSISLINEFNSKKLEPSIEQYRMGSTFTSDEEINCIRDLVSKKTPLKKMSESVKEAMKEYLCKQEFSKENRFSELACKVSKQCARLTIDSFGDNGLFGDTFRNYLEPYIQGKTMEKYFKFELGRSLPEVEKSKELRLYAEKMGIKIPDSKSCEDTSGFPGTKKDFQCSVEFFDDMFMNKQTNDCSLAFKGCYPISKEEFEKIDNNDGKVTKTEIFIEKMVTKSLEEKLKSESTVSEELFKIINSKDRKTDKVQAIKTFLNKMNDSRNLDPALSLLLENGFESKIGTFLETLKKNKISNKNNFDSALKSLKENIVNISFKDYNCFKKKSITNLCYRFEDFRDKHNPNNHVGEDDLIRMYKDEEITDDEFSGLNTNIGQKFSSKVHLKNVLNGARCFAFQPQNKPEKVGYLKTDEGEIEIYSNNKIPAGTIITSISQPVIYSNNNSNNNSNSEDRDVLDFSRETSRSSSRPDNSSVIRYVSRSDSDPSSPDFTGPPIPSDYKRPDDSSFAAFRAPQSTESDSPIVADSGRQTTSDDQVIAANNSINMPANNGSQIQGDGISGYDQFGHFTGVQEENNGLNGMNPNQLQANGSLSPATPNYIEDLNKKIAELSSKLEDQTKKSKKETEEEEKKIKSGAAVADGAASSEMQELQSELKKLKEELVKAKSSTITQTTPSASSILPNRSLSSAESSGIVSKSKASDDASTERPTRSIASISDDGIRGNDFKSMGSSVTSSQGISGSNKISGQASTTTGANISGKASGSSSAILTRMDGMNPKTQAEAITRMIQNAGIGEEILIEEGGFIKAIVPIVENGKIVVDQDGNPKYEKLIKGKATDKALMSKLAKKDSRAPASITAKTVQSAADLKQEEDKAKLEELARYRKLRCLTDAKYCDK